MAPRTPRLTRHAGLRGTSTSSIVFSKIGILIPGQTRFLLSEKGTNPEHKPRERTFSCLGGAAILHETKLCSRVDISAHDSAKDLCWAVTTTDSVADNQHPSSRDNSMRTTRFSLGIGELVMFQGKLDKRGYGISCGFLLWGDRMERTRDHDGEAKLQSKGEAGDCAGGVARRRADCRGMPRLRRGGDFGDVVLHVEEEAGGGGGGNLQAEERRTVSGDGEAKRGVVAEGPGDRGDHGREPGSKKTPGA